MKLLLIYGSPAVGKLTVAEEIASRTDFKVFHNHLSIDCVEPIFEFGSESFSKLVNLIRFETIGEAARIGRNLIYTFCYARDLDDAHISKVSATVAKHGGEVCFVLLVAEKEVLKKRVLAESRCKYGKVKTIEMMDYFFSTYDFFSPVPEAESLIIDTTRLSAAAAAQQIIEHFKLTDDLPRNGV